jgi:hypothetical protein
VDRGSGEEGRQEEERKSWAAASEEDQLLVQFAKEELAKDEEHRAAAARKEERRKIREQRQARAKERERARAGEAEAGPGSDLLSAADPRNMLEAKLQGLIKDSLKGLVDEDAASDRSRRRNGHAAAAGNEVEIAHGGEQMAGASAHELGLEVLRGVQDRGEQSQRRRRLNGHNGDDLQGPNGMRPDDMRAQAALEHSDVSDRSLASHASDWSRRSRRSKAAERLEQYLMQGQAGAPAEDDAVSVTRSRRDGRSRKGRRKVPEEEAHDRLPKLSEVRPAAAAASSNKHSSFDLSNQQDAEQFQEWLHGMFCYPDARPIPSFPARGRRQLLLWISFQTTSGRA